MQQPRLSLFQHPLLWLGAALAVTIAVVMTLPPVYHPISYVRYVSPPRLDGTRCTFLYPATLNQPLLSGTTYTRTVTGQQYQIQSVQVFSHVSSGEAFVKRFSLLKQLLPSNDEEINIVSIDDPAQPDPFPTRPIVSENRRYLKSESRDRPGGYDIILKDKLSHVKYDFQCSLSLPNAAAVVSQSFQVLPPGTALPVDTPKP